MRPLRKPLRPLRLNLATDYTDLTDFNQPYMFFNFLYGSKNNHSFTPKLL
ncbi:hypothetical protein FLAVO9R_140238 [Flavobacterium sp. 9R]|nr:hypothetical protein FLAVO9R_140238 [Flavobacterium sp. 9R]